MRIPHLAIRLYGQDARIGEELFCQREAENYTDPSGVVVMKDDNHV